MASKKETIRRDGQRYVLFVGADRIASSVKLERLTRRFPAAKVEAK